MGSPDTTSTAAARSVTGLIFNAPHSQVGRPNGAGHAFESLAKGLIEAEPEVLT